MMNKLIPLFLKRVLRVFFIFFLVLSIGMFIFWLISPRVFFNFLFMTVLSFVAALVDFHESIVPESKDNYPPETRALVERVESMTHQECAQLIKTKNLTGLEIDFEKLYDNQSPEVVANRVLFPNILKVTKDPIDVHCIMILSETVYSGFYVDPGIFSYKRRYSYNPLNILRFPSYWQISVEIKQGANGTEVLKILTTRPVGSTF